MKQGKHLRKQLRKECRKRVKDQIYIIDATFVEQGIAQFEYTKPNGQRKRKIHYDQWVIANRDISNLLPMCEVYDEKKGENVLCPIYSQRDKMKIYEKGAMIQSIMNWQPLAFLNRMLCKISSSE